MNDQRSTTDQLRDTIRLANETGDYDALPMVKFRHDLDALSQTTDRGLPDGITAEEAWRMGIRDALTLLGNAERWAEMMRREDDPARAVRAIRLDVEPGPSAIDEMLADPKAYRERAYREAREAVERENARQRGKGQP